MEFSSKQGLAAAVAAALALWTAQASAEPGFFVGASIGQSTTEAEIDYVLDVLPTLIEQLRSVSLAR